MTAKGLSLTYNIYFLNHLYIERNSGKMKKIIEKNKEKVDRHDFLIAWSTGMNEYEIAQKLGVSLETVQEVMRDLLEEDSTW